VRQIVTTSADRVIEVAFHGPRRKATVWHGAAGPRRGGTVLRGGVPARHDGRAMAMLANIASARYGPGMSAIAETRIAPHGNAKAHRKVMRAIQKDPGILIQVSISAGILTKDGRAFTKPYRDKPKRK
jgi:hypothetical protein